MAETQVVVRASLLRGGKGHQFTVKNFETDIATVRSFVAASQCTDFQSRVAAKILTPLGLEEDAVIIEALLNAWRACVFVIESSFNFDDAWGMNEALITVTCQ